MLSTSEQINILVHLSMADEHLAEEETKMIHKVGERNGLTKSEIDEIIRNPKPIPVLKGLTPDEKFDYLYNVIFLMKVDGKIFQSEIKFCEKVASAMGYKPSVVSDLSGHIYSDDTIEVDRTALLKVANNHLA
ncbi:MAG: TerB family tellurite resistance protein [Bacteroidota bacterium]